LAPFIEILQLSFCVINYAHLVYGMQMASAAWAWMYRQPQEDWENVLSGVNGFLNQAEADMRTVVFRRIWLRHSKKYVFMGHSRFLGKKHPYRAMDCPFNGEKENRQAPLHVTGDLVHLKVKDIKTIKELPKLTEKKSILWELEYWSMLDVRHSIDNMHVQKNVCEATCGTLLQ
jgi:hypothetical protein